MAPAAGFFDAIARQEEAKQAFLSLDAAGPADLKGRRVCSQRPPWSARLNSRRGPCTRRVVADGCSTNSPPELGASVIALLHERGHTLKRGPPATQHSATRPAYHPEVSKTKVGVCDIAAGPQGSSGALPGSEVGSWLPNDSELAAGAPSVFPFVMQPIAPPADPQRQERPVSARVAFESHLNPAGDPLAEGAVPQRTRPASAGPQRVKLWSEANNDDTQPGRDKDGVGVSHGASASVRLQATSAVSSPSSAGSDQEAMVQLPENIERMLDYHRKRGVASQMGHLKRTLMSHGIDNGKPTDLSSVPAGHPRRGALNQASGVLPTPLTLSPRSSSASVARGCGRAPPIASPSAGATVGKDSAMKIWKRALMARAKAQTRDFSQLEPTQPLFDQSSHGRGLAAPGAGGIVTGKKGPATGRLPSRQPSPDISDDEAGSASGDAATVRAPHGARATAPGYSHAAHADRRTSTGLVFEHSDLAAVPFKVVRFSSQADNTRHAAANLSNLPRGTGTPIRELGMWQSSGPPEQWLVLDVQREVELCGIELRCSGTQADPKDLTVLRGANDDGPWVICRRTFVHAGPQGKDQIMHRILFDGGVTCRYWRIVINQNWGTTCHVCLRAPLTLLADPRHLADAQGRAEVPSTAPSDKPRDLATLFSEAVNLSSEERELRLIARRNNIPLDYAERIRQEFRKFDTEGEGSLSFENFNQVLRAMVVHKPGGIRYRGVVNGDVPEARIRRIWQEVDTDQSGRVEYEELLVWFYSRFDGPESDGLRRGSTARSAPSARQQAGGGRRMNEQERKKGERLRPR